METGKAGTNVPYSLIATLEMFMYIIHFNGLPRSRYKHSMNDFQQVSGIMLLFCSPVSGVSVKFITL